MGEPDAEGEVSVSGILGFVPILFWLLMTVGIEQLFGATLGNYAVNLKPVSINGNGHKPSFGQSLKRHLLDPIDMFFFGIVGIVSINKSEKSQRLGDLWGETVVIDSREGDFEIKNHTEKIAISKSTSIIELFKQSFFSQVTFGISVLLIVYGYLSEFIPIHFFWESKSIGWIILLVGIIGIIAKGMTIRKNENRSTIPNKIGIGFICFTFFVQLILIIIIPRTDAYEVSKTYIQQNENIISEIGEIKSFGLIPTGSISKQTDSNGTTGSASINLIIKGEKAYKKVTVIVFKDYETLWEVYELK